ncbi:MAG: hypothetical protein KAJ14_11700, partial [Candidatus Omnitrophica bacterium]|nr:hypothetical protein [Candidatus Omnitrophota bacterium]
EFIQKKASINIHIGLEDLKQKEIESLVKLKGKEIKSLKKDFKSLFRLFGFLEKIGTTKVLPSGLGFISLELSKVKNKCFGKIRGYIFRDNDYEEKRGIDEFVENLRNEEAIKSKFPNIEVESSTRVEKKTFMVTEFVIRFQ